MTDQEFIDKLKSITSFVSDNIIEELAQQPQFKNFLERELGNDGATYMDEHYLYCAESELDYELGSRLSWFTALCYQKEIDVTDYSAEYVFPCSASSFVLDGKRYWILTMVGQGAVSWIMTDERFIKEYNV